MHGFIYEFSKIFWGGAHRAPSPDPHSSAQSQASFSILGRFASSVQAAPSIHPFNIFNIYVIFIPVYLSKNLTPKKVIDLYLFRNQIVWSRSGSRDPDVQGQTSSDT